MKFSRVQIFFLLIMFIGISNHVILLPHLLQVAHRDAWLSALIGYFVLILWSFLLVIIMKRSKNQKYSIWLKNRIGGPATSILLVLLSIYISIIALITFNDFVNTVQIYFLQDTSIWVIGFVFLIVCIWSAGANLKTIVYSALLLVPFVLILGDFVAIATFDEKNYSFIFPALLEGSEPLIRGVFIFLGAGADIILVLLIQDRIQKPLSYLSMFLLTSTLAILVIGPTMGSIASFGAEVASQMRFPAFEQWRLVTIGQHVSHLDFLAVFQMISGTFIRLTLCIFLLWDMWFKPNKKVKWTIVTAITLVLILMILPQNSDIWLQNFIQKYFYYASAIFGVAFTMFMLIVTKLKER
ncbi:endospore germination permease [Ornithinibacillus scapharcae]|uniref:endospore germination permease n=1 Tax=Ornithinibacillus scapharcae TaxID=1147159 RepID=UPI000225BD45|nr:endospore germination permease [Ornithinibacillus scapharcae]